MKKNIFPLGSMMNSRALYEQQLEKVKTMLEQFLQPWYILVAEPYEILSLSYTLLGEGNDDVILLEKYWDAWIEESSCGS